MTSGGHEDQVFPVFRALPLPCIILNTNQRTRTKNGGGLGARLLDIRSTDCGTSAHDVMPHLTRTRTWQVSSPDFSLSNFPKGCGAEGLGTRQDVTPNVVSKPDPWKIEKEGLAHRLGWKCYTAPGWRRTSDWLLIANCTRTVSAYCFVLVSCKRQAGKIECLYWCLVQQKTPQTLQGSAINKIPNIPQCTLPPLPMCQTLLFNFSRVWFQDYSEWLREKVGVCVWCSCVLVTGKEALCWVVTISAEQ